MGTYRRRPTLVEAYRFLAMTKEQRDNFAATLKTDDFFRPGSHEPMPIYEDEDGPLLWLQGKHGVSTVRSGMWIIREPDDSGWYPCDHETFKANYESVSVN